jgi:hypothetical protein
MQHASKQVSDAQRRAQRAVVALVLEHREGVARPTLEEKLHDLGGETIAEALTGLRKEGVIVAGGGRVRASRSARRLDTLGLICV